MNTSLKYRTYYNNNSIQGGGYSSQYQAVLDRATALGYTKPNDSRNSAWNTFIEARVADGSLAVMDFLYNMAWNDAGLSNFSKLNHITPASYECTDTNSPTYGVAGIQGNGTTSYRNTNFNLATNGVNYLQDSASFGGYVYAIPTVGARLFGSLGATENEIIYVSLNIHKINTTLNLTGGSIDMTGTGYKALNRSSSSAVRGYNGVTKTDRTATSAARTSNVMAIGRTNSGFSNAIISFFYGGGSLTETQHNNIANGYATFLTAIGL